MKSTEPTSPAVVTPQSETIALLVQRAGSELAAALYHFPPRGKGFRMSGLVSPLPQFKLMLDWTFVYYALVFGKALQVLLLNQLTGEERSIWWVV